MRSLAVGKKRDRLSAIGARQRAVAGDHADIETEPNK
jgi:hypothetical protein